MSITIYLFITEKIIWELCLALMDDMSNGNLQKFEQDLKRHVNYKRLNYGCLDELILREWYVSMFNR